MIAAGLNSPMAHGVGRYFDGFGALLLSRRRASYEGQVALEWNMAAEDGESHRYPYDIVTSSTPWQVDLRQTVREAVFEAIGGESIGVVAARFHNTLAAASAEVVRNRRAAAWAPAGRALRRLFPERQARPSP